MTVKELKDKVDTQLNAILDVFQSDSGKLGCDYEQVKNQAKKRILTILAIVDKEAELPSVYEIQRHFTGLSWSTCENLRQWLSSVLAGWVMEVSNE